MRYLKNTVTKNNPAYIFYSDNQQPTMTSTNSLN